MSASNRACLNGERRGFDRRTYDASVTKERRFGGLKLPRPEIFKRQHENMHRWDEHLRLQRAHLQHLADYQRRRGKYCRYHRGNKYRLNRFWVGEDFDKEIAELETTVKELSEDISDRPVTSERKQTSSNPRDSEAIRFSRFPYAYSYQKTTIKGNPWTRSLFRTPVNRDDNWTKISDLARRRIQNRIAQRNCRECLYPTKSTLVR